MRDKHYKHDFINFIPTHASYLIMYIFNSVAAFSMIFGLLLWLMFGIVLVTGIAGADICTEFDVFQVSLFFYTQVHAPTERRATDPGRTAISLASISCRNRLESTQMHWQISQIYHMRCGPTTTAGTTCDIRIAGEWFLHSILASI